MNSIGALSSASGIGVTSGMGITVPLLSQANASDPTAVVESRHGYGFDAILVALLFVGALVAICRANHRS